jgi:hypothetical protein
VRRGWCGGRKGNGEGGRGVMMVEVDDDFGSSLARCTGRVGRCMRDGGNPKYRLGSVEGSSGCWRMEAVEVWWKTVGLVECWGGWGCCDGSSCFGTCPMSVSSCAGGVSFFCFKVAVVVSKAPFADPFSSFPLHIYGDDIQSSTRRDPSVRILFIHDFEVPIPDPLDSLYPFRQFMRWKDM